jgi:transcriptional regulator with XRE-family HTH domain
MKQRTPAQVAADAGLRVRELRRASGRTQEHLANSLELSVQYLRRVESGRVNLSIVSLVRFARALDVEPSALLAPPDDRTKPKRGRPARQTEDARSVPARRRAGTRS